MTHKRWRERAALAAFVACAAGCLCATDDAFAAKKQKPATSAPPAADKGDANGETDPAKRLAAAARQAYDAALKSYANGKYLPAVEQLTSAISSGGLSPPEMAKALYTRGLAQKKLGKNGLAISDLTSALWLKNGLSDADRKNASAARAEAYSSAGLKQPEEVAQSAGQSTAQNTVVSAAAGDPSQANLSAGLSAAAIAQASGASTNKQPDAVTRQSPDSASAQDAARARQAGYAPVNDGGLQSVASSAVVSQGATAPPAATTASLALQEQSATAAQAATPAPASTSSSSTVGGFFSNLFGGGSAAEAQPAPPPAPVPVQTASSAPVAPEVSSWTSATTVNTGATSKKSPAASPVTRVAAVTPPLAVTKVSVPKGKYKVHIAAVRSRAEADALAQKLVAEHGAELANHAPTVDQAVIGSMGTFYRVRINGYASQEEPRGLCSKLRTSGFDCLVVTN